MKDINLITRNIQIDLIMDNPNPIIEKFNSMLNELSLIEVNIDDNYYSTEFIYYNSNNEWVLYLSKNNNGFLFDHSRFGKFFESTFNLNDEQIEVIIKSLAENTFNYKIERISHVSPQTTYIVPRRLENALSNALIDKYNNTE